MFKLFVSKLHFPKIFKNKQFEQLNEDSYKTKLKLDQENDEFLKYAENCIRDYHKQGKDITPLLLELKRYKKTATFA